MGLAPNRSVYPYIYPSIHLFICRLIYSARSVDVDAIYLYIHPSIYPSIYLSIYRSIVHARWTWSICPSIYLSVCLYLSIYLSMVHARWIGGWTRCLHLAIHLSIHLSIYLSAATHPGVGGGTHRRRATVERC